MTRPFRAALALIVVVVLLRGGATAAGGPGTASPDLAAVMRRVHFAFRPEATGFTGGHTTYDLEVTRQGEIAFTPYLSGVGAGAALQLTTRSIRRGRVELQRSDRSARVTADGSLVIGRGAVVERWRNSDEGAEQSWRFTRRPRGEGPLVVRVALAGEEPAGLTPRGHHFLDPRTGLGACYGSARWIDAQGRATPVEARLERGEIVLEVASGVIEGSAYPAVLDPIVSPEHGMDVPVAVPPPVPTEHPAIASDGTGFFATWVDSRTSQAVVFGTRIDAGGQVLDPAGIQISETAGFSSFGRRIVAVASGGASYLVAWVGPGSPVAGIAAARVSAAGAVLDPGGFAVSSTASSHMAPAVGWNGTSFLVAWRSGSSDGSGDGAIEGVRVSPAGAVLDATPIAIADEGPLGFLEDPAVASDGADFLVAWAAEGPGAVEARRVSGAGAILDPTAIVLASPRARAPAVTFGGGEYQAAWLDGRNGGVSQFTSEVFASRLSPGGAILDIGGIRVSPAGAATWWPTVASVGTLHLVAWGDVASGEIQAVRMSGGSLVDAAPFSVSGATTRTAWRASSAASGSGFLVAWELLGEGERSTEVRAARVTAGGAVLDAGGFAVVTPSNWQVRPALAASAATTLVVWEDYRLSGWEISGVRVAPDGSVLDPLGIHISGGVGGNHAVAAASSSSDGGFLVAWVHHGPVAEVRGARLDASGTVLNPGGVIVSSGIVDNPAVASNGVEYLVVWEDGRNTGEALRPDVFGARITAGGVVLDPSGIPIALASLPTTFKQRPAVASDGTTFLAVWESWTSGARVEGARISAAGAVSASTLISDGSTPQEVNPAVAFGKRSPGIHGKAVSPGGPPVYLVVWQKSLGMGTLTGLGGARVSRSGTLVDATSLTVAGAPALFALTFDGGLFLVPWIDKPALNLPAPPPGPPLHLATVGIDGGVSDAGILLTSLSAFPSYLDLGVASGGAGQSLAAYSVLDLGSGFGGRRVRARLLTTTDLWGGP